MNINVYVDGGARGNPGPAALGFYVEEVGGGKLASIGQKIGVSTNNIAEYSAIVAAFSWIIENKDTLSIKKAQFFMDSQLAYYQLSGIYKIKNANLRELFFIVKQKEVELGIPIFYKHVPRDLNKKADKMVNLALDNKI